MKLFPRLFMVEVQVTSWPRSVAWYRDVLSLCVMLEDQAGEFVLLEAGPGGGRVALKGGQAGQGGERSAVRLVFEVADVDEMKQEFVARGVAVEGPMTSAEGYREIRINDPDGTPIGLFAWVKPDSESVG